MSAGPMNHDAGSDFDARVAKLSPSKRALLLERLARDGHDTGDSPVLRAGLGQGRREPPATASIASAPRRGDVPLSFAQQRLWVLDRLLPDKAAYNTHAAWRVRGRLDVSALERSLGALVARHEMLRTRFTLREGERLLRAKTDARNEETNERHRNAIHSHVAAHRSGKHAGR